MPKQRSSLLVGSMSLWGIGLFFAPLFWQTVGSILLIGLVGFPHGGIDGYQMWLQSGRSLKICAGLIAKYLTISLLAWSAWWFWPFAFWAVFLVISIYHFGVSEDLFPVHTPRFTASKWIGFLSKGLLVVFVPTLSDPAAAREILSVAASPDFARAVTDLAPLAVAIALVAALATAVVEQINRPVGGFARSLLAQSLLLTSLFSLLPILVSFALYFVFVHAIPQMYARHASFSQIDARRLFAVGVCFSLPPLALLALALAREPNWSAWASQGSAYIFVVLAVLHFPHCWLSLAPLARVQKSHGATDGRSSHLNTQVHYQSI